MAVFKKVLEMIRVNFIREAAALISNMATHCHSTESVVREEVKIHIIPLQFSKPMNPREDTLSKMTILFLSQDTADF